MEAFYLVVVIPCFNEAQTLAATCASLGFGTGPAATPGGTFLILVDNNSTDATAALAHSILATSLPGTVIIGYEPEQGYVPPRHRGNLLARELAESRHWPLENVLLLQADADTYYTTGYSTFMRVAALASGPDRLLEASAAHWPAFQAAHPFYTALCDEADNRFVRLFPPKLSDEIVVDDKIAGYRLSDYFRWGGHQREFTADGEEIHAETTRLYIRARAMGALKIAVPQAVVWHSERKILAEPALHMATAGFPREASWNQQWAAATDAWELGRLETRHCELNVVPVLRARELHLLGLLSILPLHVSRALGQGPDGRLAEFAAFCLHWLPRRTVADMRLHPGLFLTDIFALIHEHGDALLAKAKLPHTV